MLFPDFSVLSNFMLEALIIVCVAWFAFLYAFTTYRRTVLSNAAIQKLPADLKDALRLQQSIRDKVLTYNDLAHAKKELRSRAQRERELVILNRQRSALEIE